MCGGRTVLLRVWLAVLVLINAMADAPRRHVGLLPFDYQRRLEEFHAAQKPNGGSAAWSLDEDASLLYQHRAAERSVSLAKVIIVGRSAKAIRKRYDNYLGAVVKSVEAERRRGSRSVHNAAGMPADGAESLASTTLTPSVSVLTAVLNSERQTRHSGQWSN